MLGAAGMIAVVLWANDRLPLADWARLIVNAAGLVSVMALALGGTRRYDQYVRTNWARRPDLTPIYGAPVVEDPSKKS